MLVFQINNNELKEGEQITSKDWLFWNAYIQGRVKDDDYILLPSFIDYIQDTNKPQGYGDYLIELENGNGEEEIEENT